MTHTGSVPCIEIGTSSPVSMPRVEFQDIATTKLLYKLLQTQCNIEIDSHFNQRRVKDVVIKICSLFTCTPNYKTVIHLHRRSFTESVGKNKEIGRDVASYLLCGGKNIFRIIYITIKK